MEKLADTAAIFIERADMGTPPVSDLPPSASAAPLTVVCYARSAQLVEPIAAQIETLQHCETEETIETLVLRAWPAECSMAENDPSSEARDRFERFRTWADRAGVSICPPFEQVTRTSTITGEHHELLRTPCLCLALYVNDQLLAVYPHTDDAQTHNVTDVIATLRTGEWPPRVTTVRPPEPTPLGSCPECVATCHSGQGVYYCRDCRWVAGRTAAGHYQPLPSLQQQWTATAGQSQPQSTPR